MQIYALDSTGFLIFADDANKYQDYQCVECRETIRLRRGTYRKAHFYHIHPNRICRQHGKGMPHLMLQQFLKNILPDGEVELECQFGSIGRIADVAWHPKHLIYEIQCSPISAEEVRERNENYASIGYQVVWIFHHERYNQARLSAAEYFLKDHPHYFSDMNHEGEGQIYDQFSIIVNGRRVHRFPLLPIDPSSPKYLNGHSREIKKLPVILHRRAKTWPIFFPGDTLDSCLNSNELSLNTNEIQRALAAQLRDLGFYKGGIPWFQLLKNQRDFFENWILRPYRAIIKLILERASQ